MLAVIILQAQFQAHNCYNRLIIIVTKSVLQYLSIIGRGWVKSWLSGDDLQTSDNILQAPISIIVLQYRSLTKLNSYKGGFRLACLLVFEFKLSLSGSNYRIAQKKKSLRLKKTHQWKTTSDCIGRITSFPSDHTETFWKFSKASIYCSQNCKQVTSMFFFKNRHVQTTNYYLQELIYFRRLTSQN